MWVNPELNASDAFIAAWLPGSEAEGLADLIFEHRDFEVSPASCPFSWPSSAAAGPVNVGDTSYQPLFEYGYGLSLKAVSDLGVLDEVDDTPETPVIPDSEIFDRRPSAPFKHAGDSSDWFGHVDRARFKSALGVVEVATADWKRQEDARKVARSGGSGQILISADEGRCVCHAGAGGNLVIHLCVHEKA